MNINRKSLEFSDIDDTYIRENGERWNAYDMITYLRNNVSDWGTTPRSGMMMVNDVLNMDISEDYDAENFEVVSLETLKEGDFPVASSSFDDDRLL